jgi:hypothetical protein
MERERYEVLTEKLLLVFYELPNFREDVTDNIRFKMLMNLLRAKTVKDFERLRSMNSPEILEVINVYDKVVASPQFKNLMDMREKALITEKLELAGALEGGIAIGEERGVKRGVAIGEEKGRKARSIELALSLFDDGFEIPVILKHTNLTEEEFKAALEERKGR